MIGIFDSGLGGLTALSELDRLMPSSDILYFGDTARIPYGSKSHTVIDKFALQDCRFLISKNVSAILTACGTVSSNSLPLLKKTFELPIIGVVDAAAKKAFEIASNGNGRIAVLGTSATVKSGTFERAILAEGKADITSRACPLFVPLAENGRTEEDDQVASIVVKEYLEDIIPLKPSAVILGCTHYPLLSKIIAKYLPSSKLISSSAEAAYSVYSEVQIGRIDPGNNGYRHYYVSDDAEGFAIKGKAFLKKDISQTVTQINIEDY